MRVTNYASGMVYRAFGGLKQMNYGNGRTLSIGYNNRMFLTQWSIPNVMGWNYAYNYFNENTGRVVYAQNLNDPTLDGQGSFIVEQRKQGGRTYALTTDFVTKSRADLGNASGQTVSNQPYLNYVARDFARDPKVEGIAVLAAQIHEIGNSLGFLTRRSPTAKNADLRRIDADPGMALEECVFGGAVNDDGSVFP